MHTILHFPAYVNDLGPLGAFWCFVVGRYCETLPRLILSKRSPSMNLVNVALDLERVRALLLRQDAEDLMNQADLVPPSPSESHNVTWPKFAYSNGYEGGKSKALRNFYRQFEQSRYFVRRCSEIGTSAGPQRN
jgi:hypothetical protein